MCAFSPRGDSRQQRFVHVLSPRQLRRPAAAGGHKLLQNDHECPRAHKMHLAARVHFNRDALGIIRRSKPNGDFNLCSFRGDPRALDPPAQTWVRIRAHGRKLRPVVSTWRSKLFKIRLGSCVGSTRGNVIGRVVNIIRLHDGSTGGDSR